MYIRRGENWVNYIAFYVMDLAVMNAACLLAYFLKFYTLEGFYDPADGLWRVAVYMVLLILSEALLGSMHRIYVRGPLSEFLSVFLASVVFTALMSLFIFMSKSGERTSRLLIIHTGMFFMVLDYFARLIMKKAVIAYKKKTAAFSDRNGVFVVTEAGSAEKFLSDISSDYLSPKEIRGIIYVDGNNSEGKLPDNVPVFTDYDEAARFICREWIDEVFIGISENARPPKEFISRCQEMGITVHQELELSEVSDEKSYVENIGKRTVVTTSFGYIVPRQAFVKRIMDIIGGFFGCIAALLIGLIIGPIIYIASPGPILFRQKRIGRNGRPFYLLKFRSMYPDAEERKKALQGENRVSGGMMFKLDFDPRIIGNKILPDGTKKTGIGDFIRRTSLDEFPQFFNVLKGDMSLVGTRPPTVDEWEKYEFHHRSRLSTRPGITGMWQVSGRSEITDFEEVVRLDTEYIANYRISLDIKILLKTVGALIKGRGAM